MQTKVPAPAAGAEKAAGPPAQRSISSVPGIGAHPDYARPQAMTLQRLQQTTSNSARVTQLGGMQATAPPSQRSEAARQPAATPQGNGLPPHLKHGIENLSGISMDGVTVHYNSPQPAQLRAHAFAQGSDIHLGPGQEAHLPHEAWHVVQQAQGRVKPMFQMKTGVSMNDDAGLENEADAMGTRALSSGPSGTLTESAMPGMNLQRQSAQGFKTPGRDNNMPVQPKLVVATRTEGKPEEKPEGKPEEKLEEKPEEKPEEYDIVDHSKEYEEDLVRSGNPEQALERIVTTVMGHLQLTIALEASKEGPAGEDGKKIQAAFSTNTEKIKKQLGKWIEDKPGDPRGTHPDFGRKQQYRIYTNYYDLARALLGWILAKPGRKEEKRLANMVYGNFTIELRINSLMGKVEEKIKTLELLLKDPNDPGRYERIVKELSEDKVRGTNSHLGIYQHYFDVELQEEKRLSLKTNIDKNQMRVIQAPFQYSFKDKVVVLHDLMEYFTIMPNMPVAPAGQGLLPEPSSDKWMSTTKIDEKTGERTDSSDSRGKLELGEKLEAKLKSQKIKKTNAMRDESDAGTQLARQHNIPVWSGQSFTAMRMFALAEWAGATQGEMTALAWAIFAFWRKDYDHRVELAYHTLHEVMDIASNFGVKYSLTNPQRELPGEHLSTESKSVSTEKKTAPVETKSVPVEIKSKGNSETQEILEACKKISSEVETLIKNFQRKYPHWEDNEVYVEEIEAINSVLNEFEDIYGVDLNLAARLRQLPARMEVLNLLAEAEAKR